MASVALSMPLLKPASVDAITAGNDGVVVTNNAGAVTVSLNENVYPATNVPNSSAVQFGAPGLFDMSFQLCNTGKTVTLIWGGSNLVPAASTGLSPIAWDLSSYFPAALLPPAMLLNGTALWPVFLTATPTASPGATVSTAGGSLEFGASWNGVIFTPSDGYEWVGTQRSGVQGGSISWNI